MISGGIAKYGETRKIAEYENKRADAEITFSVADGSDGVAEYSAAMSAAKNLVKTALGSTPMSVAKEPTPEVEKPARPTKKITGGKAVKSAGDTPPASTASDPADMAETPPQISASPEDRRDPADIEEVADAADLGFLDGPAEDAVLSDQDLMAEVSKQVARLVKTHGKDAGNKAARTVKEKYAPLPKQTIAIPQGSRAQFIAELQALK